MDLNTLIKQLSTCQVLHSGDELYEDLTEMESYNDKNSNVEDCYIIY